MNNPGGEKTILNVMWWSFILVFLLFACQPVERTATQIDIVQTSPPSPAATFTMSPFPTLTPSLSPLTPTQTSLERLAFSVAKRYSGTFSYSVIAFANSDGTDLEFPDLFEPFRGEYDYGGVSGAHLVWSPDGHYLAFDGADKIFSCGITNTDCTTTNYGTLLADYSQGVIIKQIEGTLTNSSWSLDSQNLVLSIDDKQSSGSKSYVGDLFILDVKSGRKTRLTNHPSSDLYPAWSPDGQQIAFIRYTPTSNCGPFPRTDSFDDCDNTSLYVIRPDGTNLKLLLEPVHVETPIDGRHKPYNAPSWSPDSQWLAIMVEKEGVPHIINQEIALVNVETGELRRLTDNKALDVMPTWSPDGKRLAFVSDRDGNEEIFVMNIDGTSPVNLTNNPALDYAPVWSPSGNYIAFMSNRGKLYIMNADGTNQIPVNGDYLGTIGRPSWLPLIDIAP